MRIIIVPHHTVETAGVAHLYRDRVIAARSAFWSWRPAPPSRSRVARRCPDTWCLPTRRVRHRSPGSNWQRRRRLDFREGDGGIDLLYRGQDRQLGEHELLISLDVAGCDPQQKIESSEDWSVSMWRSGIETAPPVRNGIAAYATMCAPSETRSPACRPYPPASSTGGRTPLVGAADRVGSRNACAPRIESRPGLAHAWGYRRSTWDRSVANTNGV